MDKAKTRARNKQWLKDNTHMVTGLRPLRDFECYTTDMILSVVNPDCLFTKSAPTKPATLHGTDLQYHLPRSLCKRAKVLIHNKTGAIVAKFNMVTAQPKL